MSKINTWELTPSILRKFASEAQLSKRQKKKIMNELAEAALDGKTHTILYFPDNEGECILTNKYLQALGYGVVQHPFKRALMVSWKEKNKDVKF